MQLLSLLAKVEDGLTSDQPPDERLSLKPCQVWLQWVLLVIKFFHHSPLTVESSPPPPPPAWRGRAWREGNASMR